MNTPFSLCLFSLFLTSLGLWIPFFLCLLSQRDEEEDDEGQMVGEGDVIPALDLVRTMSMSSDKDILRQLRDAMNPKQKQQAFVMVVQAGLALVAVGILLAVVIVGYISLVRIGTAVQTMADQTTQLKNITKQTSEKMTALTKNLEPVAILPELDASLQQMNDDVDTLTNTMCGSPLFAATCPADFRAGVFGPTAGDETPAGGKR